MPGAEDWGSSSDLYSDTSTLSLESEDQFHTGAQKRLAEFHALQIEDHAIDLTSHELLSHVLRLRNITLSSIFDTPDFTTDLMIELVAELERRGVVLRLLMGLIGVQLQNTTEGTLFREDNVANRLMSVYLFTRRNKKFLSRTVAPIVMEVVKSKEVIELNPAKAGEGQEGLSIALRSREIVSRLVISLLEAAREHLRCLPIAFGFLVQDTQTKVRRAFQDTYQGNEIVGSFFFLRFICPALVSPFRYNVPVSCSEDDLDSRALRGLVYISKVLQAVGSGVRFDKEEHMLPFNSVLDATEEVVQRLYSELLSRGARVTQLMVQKAACTMPKRVPVLHCSQFVRERCLELNLKNKVDELSASPTDDAMKVHPALWTNEEVCTWLRSVDMHDVIQIVREKQMQGADLLYMSGRKMRVELGLAVRSRQTEFVSKLRELLSHGLDFIPDHARNAVRSPEALWRHLRSTALKSIVRQIRKLELSVYDILHLSHDDLLVCGSSRTSMENGFVELRSLQFWTDLDDDQRGVADLGAEAIVTHTSVADDRMEQWYDSLSGSLDLTDILSQVQIGSSKKIKWSFECVDNYVSGNLRMKHQRKWKTYWMLLNRTSKQLSIYSRKKAPATVSSETIALLGAPKRLINIVDCAIRDGDSFTNKEGTISLLEKGKSVKYVLCPTKSVAQLWMSELLKYTMIMAVESMNVEMFDAPAVASTDQGVIVAINQAALILWGYSEEEVMGKNVAMLMPDSIAQYHHSYLSSYRKYRDRRLIGKKRVVNIKRKDGSEPHCLIRLGEFYEDKKLRFVATFNYDDALIQQEMDMLRSEVEMMLDNSDDESDEVNWSDDEEDAAPVCMHATRTKTEVRVTSEPTNQVKARRTKSDVGVSAKPRRYRFASKKGFFGQSKLRKVPTDGK